MNYRLLTAFALCAATSSTIPLWAAVNVDKPEVSSTVEFDETNGGNYYIYNLGAKMFLTAGNAWGTQASLGETGYNIEVKQTTDATTSLSGWTFEYPKEAPGNNGGKPKYLFIDVNTDNTFVDYNMSGTYLWQIVKQENGSYRISVIAEDPNYGSSVVGHVNYLGQINSDLTVEGLDNTIVTGLIDPDVYDLEQQDKALIDWAFVSPEVYDVYIAKRAFYEVLERADESGYTETHDYEAIYNKSDVTVEELEQASKDLTAAIDEFVYSLASEDNPIDLTSKIQNADFGGTGNFNSSGWILNGMGSGPNSHIVENSERVISAYSESWVPSNNKLSDVSTLQTIKGLPGGKYKLYVDMIAVQQGNEALETSGAYLVADGGFGEVRKEHKTNYSNGIGRTVELDFNVLEGADVTIGVRTIAANFNWFAVDNFRLELVGVFSAMEMAKSELKKQITDSEEYFEMEVIQNGKTCSNKGREAFEQMLQLAKDGYVSEDITEDSLASLSALLKQRTDSIMYDINFYNGTEFTDKMYEIEQLIYENSAYPSDENFIFTETETYWNSLNEAFGALEFNPKDFDGIDAVVDSLYRKDIYNALVAGTTSNVTGLIVNPNFDNDSNYGWAGGPTVAWGIAEFYNSTSYNLYQTLKGLPEGSYKIKMNGYYRPGENSVCANGDEETNKIYSYLYANDANTQMAHMYDHVFDDPPLTNEDGSPRSCFIIESTNPEINGKYIIDGRECMYYVLLNDPTLYTNEVVCYVGEDGELTFGVKNIGTPVNSGNWTTFDNFRIEYLGANDLSGYKSSVETLVRQIDDIISTSSISSVDDILTQPSLPVAVETEMLSAREEADSKILLSEDYTAEVAQLVVDRLNAAILLADSALVRSNDLIHEYARAIEVTSFVESDYAGYVDCMYEYEDVGSLGFESIDQVNEWIVKFKKEYTNYMIYGKTEGASKDVPVELTDAIVNPGFEKTDALTGEVSYTSDGWDFLSPATDVNYSVIEFWQKNFEMSQDIYGLPSGYYRLEVNGYFRGSGTFETAANYRDGVDTLFSIIYAEGASVPYAVPVMSICEDASDVPLTSININVGDSLYTGDDIENAPAKYIPNAMSDSRVAFDAGLYKNILYFKIDEGQEKLTIGVRKTELRANDWTVLDNFRLYYYGYGEANMPDGIGEITEGKSVVVGTSYYTIDGVQVSKPTQRGLYIREDIMSDGTKRTRKVMVR